MGLVKDALKGVGWGAGIGFGLLLVSPLLGSSKDQSRRGRPLAKRAVRGLLDLTDRLREMGAEAKEQMSDLVAEVESERQAARPNGHRKRASMAEQVHRQGRTTARRRSRATARG